jgi:hypothetical protein
MANVSTWYVVDASGVLTGYVKGVSEGYEAQEGGDKKGKPHVAVHLCCVKRIEYEEFKKGPLLWTHEALGRVAGDATLRVDVVIRIREMVEHSEATSVRLRTAVGEQWKSAALSISTNECNWQSLPDYES